MLLSSSLSLSFVPRTLYHMSPDMSLVSPSSLPRMLQKAQETDYIDINCIDPLGRSALLMAIDNENLEMVELLINHNVDTKDALLHAISEEFVEAVEVLLDHEDSKLQTGGKHVNDSHHTLLRSSAALPCPFS